MSVATEILDAVRKLSALEARTEDVRRAQDRLESKLDELIDRLSRIEANYEGLRTNVRNEILADIKGDLARVQVYIDLSNDRFLPPSREPRRPDLDMGSSPTG
jgi:predicted transcriptional regulator